MSDGTAQLVGQGADRLREAEALLAVSTTVNATLDVSEALRLICRELARLLGADTAAAYRHDGISDQLMPVAGYHVPKELVQTLLSTPMSLRDQGFYAPIWRERRPVLSDDVAADPRFTHELFRRFPHQSGLILPLVLDDRVAGAFYLVWWTARRQLTEREQELVASITGQVTVLLNNARRFETAERERLHLGVMYDLARRMAAVHDTDQLLTLLVEEAAGQLGAEAAGIRLLEGDELVPLVKTDPQLLRQVLLNLVSNAVKYTPPGGAIAIAMGREGQLARWAISDTGIGIPGASRARLFEKFYRADNVTEIETEGTGLGLYLVRLILGQLGGDVSCMSQEGKGSTFVVTLPMAA